MLVFKMIGDICLFSFTLLDTGALIFILVFFIITLSGEYSKELIKWSLDFELLQILSVTTSMLKSAVEGSTSGTFQNFGCSFW